MIMTMEQKFNGGSAGLFRFMNRRDPNISKISVAQYWDWLTYLDDDYLSDYEIIRMKELYYWQLQELTGQTVVHAGVGWGFAVLLMGPIVRSHTHAFWLRFPIAATFTSFLALQAAAWERSNKTFHDLVSQPAPHGSYVRKSIKEHFPVWWHKVSADLHKSGYSLPEMNEYDRATEIQKSHTQFDDQIL